MASSPRAMAHIEAIFGPVDWDEPPQAPKRAAPIRPQTSLAASSALPRGIPLLTSSRPSLATADGAFHRPKPRQHLLPLVNFSRTQLEAPRIDTKAQAPPWWTVPAEVARTADRYDERHAYLAQRSRSAYQAMRSDVTSERAQRDYQRSLLEVRYHRLHVPLRRWSGAEPRPTKRGKKGQKSKRRQLATVQLEPHPPRLPRPADGPRRQRRQQQRNGGSSASTPRGTGSTGGGDASTALAPPQRSRRGRTTTTTTPRSRIRRCRRPRLRLRP